MDEIFCEIREAVLSGMEREGFFSDEELKERIDRELYERSGSVKLNLAGKLALKKRLYNSMKRLDVLQELIEDKNITEIMINSHREIFVEKNNRMERWKQEIESEEKLEDIIQQIVSRINRRVNTSSPIADARLPDGSRVHIVLPPVAIKGPTITIRKFPEPIEMDKMIRYQTISAEAAGFMKELVEAGYNIFISGGTSSGKSTFLNALSGFIPSDERVITIEDSAELKIRHIPNLVSLETRDANTEGEGEISMTALIKASLRMRPDRIIVGEVRGAEAFDMLSAMNTGHDGSLSTGHANSTADMLTRLESMVLQAAELPLSAIKSQIAAGLDIMVHLARMPDKSRRVVEISEVDGVCDGEIRLNKIFEYDPIQKRLKCCGELIHREKLIMSGSIGHGLQHIQAYGK